MLNSTVLEVAAGLIFTFLGVSLATSAMVEAIASIIKLRSRALLQGVKDLLNDPNFAGLAKQLYAHALVNPRGPGSGAPETNKPAYIEPQGFAEALLDVVRLTDQLRPAGGPPPTVAGLQAAVAANVTDVQIRTLLQGAIQRGLGDYDTVKQEIAAWFDSGMDRVSGAYKRWSQLIGFVIALILCVGLNVDAVHISRALWANPSIATNVKPTGSTQEIVKQLVETFPVGWPNGLFTKASNKDQQVQGAITGDYGEAVVGWLITAIATLFGAPFWFDALQSVIRLKGAGPSPKEKSQGKAAAA